MRKIKLPFSNKKAGNKSSSFKIMNEQEMNKSLFSFIKKILSSNGKDNKKKNKNQNKNNKSNDEKIQFIKGSLTKDYYKKIKK